jgi:type I restriction enzyme M protein
MATISETETVIKKIIPYLRRRGYDEAKDFTFEYPVSGSSRANLGFVDILVTHAGKIAFLVEAKRIAKTLSQKDRDQAISYGKDVKAPFVVLTNGSQFESYNSQLGKRIRWNGKLNDKVPSKTELPDALTALRKDPTLLEVPLGKDTSLPFRPGLPLKQLNALFSRCHNTIRKIERNEDYAFTDFAKLLFLKLLEEKADSEGTPLPYTYRFHELSEKPETEADQVKTAAISMLDTVKRETPYGDVIREGFYLKNAKTFQKIVHEMAAVSFRDSRTDTKGAAFEYFVRATLKGKKLGQYFTPRALIDLMQSIVGKEKVVSTLAYNGSMQVVDPACGTGGFLVYFMLNAVEQADELLRAGKINASRRDELVNKIKREVFFGADAHEGVASSAKMNMIIAGDGHSNIQWQDTLASTSTIWSVAKPNIDLIITNPPFGISESESMAQDDLSQFPVGGAKGQILFLQKMVQSVKPGGEICTVIDEGLLNTEQAALLRGYIMEHMIIRSVIKLPEVTFKPNKINVKSSVLHMIKRQEPAPDLDEEYPILFLDVRTLGYQGSGEAIRNLDFRAIVDEIAQEYHGAEREIIGVSKEATYWRWFTCPSTDLAADPTKRFDLKYWDPAITTRLDQLRKSNAKTIAEINTIKTKRGKSPSANLYVDEEDGYALVIKAGTNISKQGTVTFDGDYIEKSVYDDMSLVHVRDGDILLSSTGDGTLGKCAVYRSNKPAIFDGHVALIRVDQKKIHPEYLCDYLRVGFGAAQVARFFTGSTGLIELPPDQVDRILVKIPNRKEQESRSNQLRNAEAAYSATLGSAQSLLLAATENFRAE